MVPRNNALKKSVNSSEPVVDVSPEVSDEIRKTTCYMCACRCGINVHIRDNKIRYIEGNKDHPINKGVLCAKGSAGIMQHYSPARLKQPMKRVGPRGSGEFNQSRGKKRSKLQLTGLSQFTKLTQKNWLFSQDVINHKLLQAGGLSNLALQILRRMVVFVRSTWLPVGSTQLAVHSGSLVHRIGTVQKCLYCLAWLRTMTPTR